MKAINQQINNIAESNNLKYHDLNVTTKWFDRVEQSWNQKSYLEGRLYQCDQVCNQS